MYLKEIVLPCSSPQLPHSLDERSTLDISHRSSKLDDTHIRLLVRIINRYPCDPLDPILDGIGQVRHHLHSPTKIISTTFALYNMLIYLASRYIVLARKGDVQIALVIAQVEVDLPAVVEDEDLTMSAKGLVEYCAPSEGCPYSVGAMVPASTFIYGSTLIEETCKACQRH